MQVASRKIQEGLNKQKYPCVKTGDGHWFNNRWGSTVAFWDTKHYVNRQRRSDMKSSGVWYYKPQITLSFCSPTSLTEKAKPPKCLPQNELGSWLRIQKEIWAWDILNRNLTKQMAILHYTAYCQKTNTIGSDPFKTIFFPEKVSVLQNSNHTVQHFLIWETQFSIKRGLVFFYSPIKEI